MKKNASHFLLAALAWGVFLFAGAVRARARGPSGTLSERGYQEMRRLAHELDEVASHANDQAQHQQAWIYNNDRAFLRSVARFADRAERFHERMDTYRTQPWQVDDELRRLIRDARDVQARAQRARSIDQHTAADWDRVVNILSQMIRVYQADIGRRSWDAWDGYGSRYAAPAPPPPDASLYGGRVPDRSQLASLATELQQRAERVYNYATAAAGPFAGPAGNREALDSLLRLRDQARTLRDEVQSNPGGGSLQRSVIHLVQDARDADARLQQSNLLSRSRDDWQEVMRLVYQIQAIAGS